MSPSLRDYQILAIERLRESLGSGHRRPVLQAATGAGKTVIAAEIIRRARERGKRVAFCVPALSLIDQTVERFFAAGIREMGVCQSDHPMTNPAQPVQICSLQTLEKRGVSRFDLVLIDECHRMSRFVNKWCLDPAWAAVPFIGLSATPWARGMGRIYDDLIVVATTAELIARGYLCPFRVFAPSHPDLGDVPVVGGDYQEKALSAAMSKATLIADVIETWGRRGEGRPSFCFAVDRAHAKHLEAQFTAAGVACGYQDAFTPPAERARLRRRFHDGGIKVLCNVGTLTTGIDWDVRCLILARPTRSEILFTQMVGRALRPAPGKAEALILDHSDNHLRLGFVTDIHHERLDQGERRVAAPKPRRQPLKACPECGFVRGRGGGACPGCGFVAQVQSGVRNEAGELSEIPHTLTRLTSFGTLSREAGEGRDGDAEFYGQLKTYAAARGFRPGWAANQFRARTGVWPNHVRNAAPRPVTQAVARWIRSTLIAYAHSR
ncbi:MAG TPA: DEAD/DEAH box helicase [Stellaceae bacterium]|nr:DEAD/DEAH box helicase [Stellaceae bacterium]